MLVSSVTRWIGYLEHGDTRLLGVFNANVGKGGCTIFAQMAWDEQHIDLMGLPWCVTFVHAVVNRPDVLGPACAGCKTLRRRMKRSGLWRGRGYLPRPGDLVFCANDGWNVDHVGIVVSCCGGYVLSVDGNSVDESGHFNKKQGGAVALRKRRRADGRIVGYGAISERT